MDKIKIVFPDSSTKYHNKGTTPLEIIEKDIGVGLAKAALAVKLDDEKIDLNKPLKKGGKFRVLTFKDDEGVDIFRHSTAHVMAEAVTSLYPNALPTIGPNVEEGFYYDFDIPMNFSPNDLEKIEKKMEEIVKKDEKFERMEITKNKALEIFKDNPYKVELINELGNEKISAYRQGNFIDLCRGPHLPSTGRINAFKLTKVAGAYWRGKAEEKQLQRIYGISFPDKKQLKKHLDMLKEAEKRDHRKLGKDLDLFSIHDEGPGFPFFHPKGMVVLNTLLDFWREEHNKAGYHEIKTPILLNRRLWEQSGHW
jgi:threonyl-tRNA synthetase